MARVSTEKELAKAVKNEEMEIIIEGDLAKKVVRIKAVGNVAWLVAAGAIAVAITSVLTAPTTAGISAVVGAPAMAATVTTLGGVSVTTAAVAIAVAGGGVACLNKLREYDIEKKNDNKVVLRK